MSIHETSLSASDTQFFYRILYQYEKEGSDDHKGYSINDVPSEIKEKIELVHDTKKKKITLAFPQKANILLFKGDVVSVSILRHLRHSFAHACIERDGDNYIINQSIFPKCKICGKVNRKYLIDLVNGILATKK